MTFSLDHIESLDQRAFLWLNGLHTPLFDNVMYAITYKFTWIPLYLLLILWTVRIEKKRWPVIIGTVLVAVALADKITSGVMKPYFGRLRPCHDPTISALIHQVGSCGGQYGFASSHASTSFALTTVWLLLLKDRLPAMAWLPVWAVIYSYSRIYVGVHYPGDILIGALIGTLTGYLAVFFYRTIIKKHYYN
jgi:undecaprenyl-diphosphatase